MDYVKSLQVLYNISEESVSTKHYFHDFLWKVTNQISTSLELEDFIIYLPCSETMKYVQTTAYGSKVNPSGGVANPLKVMEGQGVVGAVLSEKKVIHINDTTLDQRYIPDDVFRQSELTVPIIWNERVYAIIDTENSRPHFFTKERVYVLCLLSKLLAPMIYRNYKSQEQKFTSENKYYQHFIRLLENEKIYLEEEISLARISSQLGISASYLSQIIHSVSNQGFKDHINDKRIEHALMLMNQNFHQRYSISSVGYEVGYRSKSSFYKNFSRKVGMTPTKYITRAICN